MKKKIVTGLLSAILLVSCIFTFAGCDLKNALDPSPAQSSSQSTPAPATPAGKTADVSYLDVGQADAQLIRLPDGTTILIDAGDRGSANQIVPYLKNQGVTKIDLLIATHPHADHIGGMANVIRELDIGKIYVPRVADSQTPTTKTYEAMLKAISDKKLKMTQAKAGMTVYEADGAKLEFLAPNAEKYDDMNNYSIVTKLTYGKTAFLFTGDAEAESEAEILKQYSQSDLACDVLKVGHHGSTTSTTDRFLEAALPRYAVISCGVGNDYGHPHREILQKLTEYQAVTYRTDTQGTILAVSDGATVTMTPNQPSVISKS